MDNVRTKCLSDTIVVFQTLFMRINCNKPCKTPNTVQGVGMYSINIYCVLLYSPPFNSSSDVTLSSVAWSHKFKQVLFRAF